MTDLWENKIFQEKIERLRVKWLEAKKKDDLAMCAVIERQVKALKLSVKKEK